VIRSAAQPDLFAQLVPACGDCHQLEEKPIDSGIRYCWGELTWRFPTDRVDGCVYRAKPKYRPERPAVNRAESLRDLLENPRHSISEKDRAWLRKELRAEERKSRRAA